MPIESCHSCNQDYQWEWEDAFLKFGFGDGDDIIETPAVQEILEAAGYSVTSEQWGVHNTVISSIQHEGTELMPQDDLKFVAGYDDPREYLPKKIIELLDTELAKSKQL